LDATSQIPIDPSYLTLFEEQAQDWAATVVLRLLRAEAETIRKGEFFAWDVLAAMSLTEPGLLRFRQVALTVRKRDSESGRLVLVNGARPNAHIAYKADAALFRRRFYELLP
jgi:inosine-uridine nucleoside N-ribohydrolase